MGAVTISLVAFFAGLMLFDPRTPHVPGVNTVVRIDASSGAFEGPIPVGSSPNGIAFAGGSGWVTNDKDQTVQQIEPSTGETVGSATSTSDNPTGMVGGPHGVFITTGYATPSRVLSVNLNTSQAEPVCEVPSSTYAIAQGGGSL